MKKNSPILRLIVVEGSFVIRSAVLRIVTRPFALTIEREKLSHLLADIPRPPKLLPKNKFFGHFSFEQKIISFLRINKKKKRKCIDLFFWHTIVGACITAHISINTHKILVGLQMKKKNSVCRGMYYYYYYITYRKMGIRYGCLVCVWII
jgi:hypothetical protein